MQVHALPQIIRNNKKHQVFVKCNFRDGRKIYFPLFSCEIVSRGLFELNTGFPATKTSAPSFTNCGAFFRSTRSEEHTSELQSHSFISYAVFCLKKKKNY